VVVPDVREPHLRVLQIQRAGKEQPGSDSHITGAVHLQESVDVLPHGGQPGQNSRQFWLGMLRLQFQLEEPTSQETAQETLHGLHVICCQDL